MSRFIGGRTLGNIKRPGRNPPAATHYGPDGDMAIHCQQMGCQYLKPLASTLPLRDALLARVVELEARNKRVTHRMVLAGVAKLPQQPHGKLTYCQVAAIGEAMLAAAPSEKCAACGDKGMLPGRVVCSCTCATCGGSR